MTELWGIATEALITGMLGVYALAFLSGGIYYLEQRVERIRDQFPGRELLARLTGYASLGIGILAFVSIGGCFLSRDPDFRIGALVATMAGTGFWIYRIHFDLTLLSRMRDGVLAFVCAVLSVLISWWVKTI